MTDCAANVRWPQGGALLGVGCPYCGALQHYSAAAGFGAASCSVCASELERRTGRSLPFALACASSVFLLLIPANLLPFLGTAVLGVSRNSRLISGAAAMWQDGWPLLAIVICLFVVILPLVRFGCLTLVLGLLQTGRRAPWLGRAFRFANGLQQWAMPDVFLLGLWVAYARLSGTISVAVGPGAVCFILAGTLSLLTRAALNRAAIWRAIGDDVAPAPGVAQSTCPGCDLLAPASEKATTCPRCGDKIVTRATDAVGRAAALTIAGLIFYIPANIFPIATLPIGLHPTQYNVLEGVIDLAQAKLFGLALLVFTASFAIPFLKLAGLGYCLLSVVRRSHKRLVLKTRIYRVVEELGRWSMVDPFVIACFVPVMKYNNLIYARAEPAAPAFATVVVLTMIAARAFDPRLMWDAALRAKSDMSAAH
jgi:paraquat-inducible protein A